MKEQTVVDVRSESSDPGEYAGYLRELKDPVEKVRQGKEWMSTHTNSLTDGLEVATVILNALPALLSQYDQLKADSVKE